MEAALRVRWIVAALLLLGLTTSSALAAPGSAVRVVDVPATGLLDVQLDDGSTERVRLLGVATQDPDANPACGNSNATARTQELVAGQSVTLQVVDGQPPLATGGQIPAYVFLADGRNLGEVLLNEGAARGEPGRQHPQAANFARGEASAITSHLGVWAKSACTATLSDDERAALAAFVLSSQSAVQQAHMGLSVLHEQARSAPLQIQSPDWQKTTAMALGWVQAGATSFQSSASVPSDIQPVDDELTDVGKTLAADAATYADASTRSDVDQVQAATSDLDASDAALVGVATRLAALASAYDLGD
jgi:endonuclease YncB( thermonuclease family)